MQKFYCLFLSLVFIFSCEKRDSYKSTEIQKLTKDVGIHHNDGLNFIINSLSNVRPSLYSSSFELAQTVHQNTEIQDSISPEELVTNTFNYVLALPEYNDIILEDKTSFINLIKSIEISENGIQNKWNESYQSAYNLKGSAISYREANILSEINQIFKEVNGQKLSEVNTYNLLKEKFNSLKQKNCDVNFNDTEGELINGLIEIALYSNEYWNTEKPVPAISSSFSKDNHIAPRMANASAGVITSYSNSLPVEPIDIEVPSINIPPGYIVELDCIGYISGWVSAVISDHNRPGGIQKSGQRARIGQGLIGALTTSVTGKIPMKRNSIPVPDEDGPIHDVEIPVPGP